MNMSQYSPESRERRGGAHGYSGDREGAVVPCRDNAMTPVGSDPDARATVQGMLSTGTTSFVYSLQRSAGNRAVVKAVGSGSGRNSDPHANNWVLLKTMPLLDLCRVYATAADWEFVTERDAFSRDWLEGIGGPLFLHEIDRRLAALVEGGAKTQLEQLAASVAVMQGDAIRRARLAIKVAARIPQVLRPGNRFLSALERQNLERLTGNDIDRAFAAFLAACSDHKDAIKAAAKVEAEILGAVIDVLAGFLAPAVSRSLSRFANQLPLSPSMSGAHLNALALLDTPDFTKAAFTGVMKATNTFLKVNSMALFGEGEADNFLVHLADWQQQQAHDLDAQLPKMSDEVLLVIAAAHLPAVSNLSAYRERLSTLLEKFQKEVQPIGTVASSEASAWFSTVGWVKGRNRLQLARLTLVASPSVNQYRFVRWVSPEMQDLALAKAGPKVETIKADEVSGLPVLWGVGPPTTLR